MNDKIAVHLTTEQWAAIIRLMTEGDNEGSFYVGRDAENEALFGEICGQTGITKTEAEVMEPDRDPYVPA